MAKTSLKNFPPAPMLGADLGGAVHDGNKKGLRIYKSAPLISRSTQEDSRMNTTVDMKLRTPNLNGSYSE